MKKKLSNKNVNFVILKLQPIAVISKLYTKMKFFNKIPYKYFLNTLSKLKNTFALQLLDLLYKRACMFDKKKKLRQNTVCLKQPIYTSQENFTKPVVVMVDTFRMSAV